MIRTPRLFRASPSQTCSRRFITAGTHATVGAPFLYRIRHQHRARTFLRSGSAPSTVRLIHSAHSSTGSLTVPKESESTDAGTTSPASVASPNYTAPIALLCAVTGLVDAVAWTEANVWVAFMTGTTVQLGMSLPDICLSLFHSPSPSSFISSLSASDASRILSLGGFCLGIWTGGKLGNRYQNGPKWMAASCLIQALWLGIASVGLVLSTDATVTEAIPDLPHPRTTLSLMSISMGLQAILVQRLAQPFGSSVALTGVWLSIMPPNAKNRPTALGGIAAMIVGAASGMLLMKYGGRRYGEVEDEHRKPESSGNVAATTLAAGVAMKVLAAAMFWLKGRRLR